MTDEAAERPSLIETTADIVSAFVAHNSVSSTDLPTLIRAVHGALTGLLSATEPVLQPAKPEPAVPIRKSITPDYIVSLEDGRKFKSMKRHLGLLGMTPEQYRVKWGLPPDYPMVAPNYAAARSALAKSIGLGRKARALPGANPKPSPRGKAK